MSASKPELPRGLYRISRSPYLFFSWRDSRGRQHMQSTRTTDPVDALVFKRQFLELKQQEDPDEKAEDLSKLSLSAVAEKYFEWKGANCSEKTIGPARGPKDDIQLVQKKEKEITPASLNEDVCLQAVHSYLKTYRNMVRPKKPA